MATGRGDLASARETTAFGFKVDYPNDLWDCSLKDTEHHSFGSNTRLRWTFNPRGELFLIYNHNLREIEGRWRRDANELLVKVQYTFRR